MKKDLFDLLKEFIIENANEYETFTYGEGFKETLEKPQNYDFIVTATIEGEMFDISYDLETKDRESISICANFSNLKSGSGKGEYIDIIKENDKIKINTNITNKK